MNSYSLITVKYKPPVVYCLSYKQRTPKRDDKQIFETHQPIEGMFAVTGGVL